jgi:hypothetical protein
MNGFALACEGFDPAGEGLLEALTSTGNGYMCSCAPDQYMFRLSPALPAEQRRVSG